MLCVFTLSRKKEKKWPIGLLCQVCQMKWLLSSRTININRFLLVLQLQNLEISAFALRYWANMIWWFHGERSCSSTIITATTTCFPTISNSTEKKFPLRVKPQHMENKFKGPLLCSMHFLHHFLHVESLSCLCISFIFVWFLKYLLLSYSTTKCII